MKRSDLGESKSIPARIKRLLKHFGVNKRKLALMLRVSESTVSRWKKGIGTKRTHRLSALNKLEETMRLAEKTFAKDKAVNWYHREFIGLNMVKPIDYMTDHENGLEVVRNVMGCIKWGVPL